MEVKLRLEHLGALGTMSETAPLDLLLLFFSATATVCDEGIDLGFIVDRSLSVGKRNFQKVKKFLADLSDRFDMAPNKTRMGMILFAGEAEVNLKFSQSTNNSGIKKNIRKIPNKLYRRTFHYKALEKALTVLFQQENGDRPSHKDVLMVLTDGRPSRGSLPYEPAVKKLEVSGLYVIFR